MTGNFSYSSFALKQILKCSYTLIKIRGTRNKLQKIYN